MSVKHIGFNFKSKLDNLTIDAMAVVPTGDIKGVVLIVHGMCEHKERYYDFMDYLANKGYLSVIHDNRGHGESIMSKDDYGFFYKSGDVGLISDAYQMLKLVKEKISDVPYIMIGHSMGSMIARCLIKKHDDEIDKLILLGSPSKAFGVEPCLLLCKLMEVIFGKKKHSKLLDYIVCNSIYEKRFKHEKLPHSWLSSDRRVVYDFNENPKCQFTFSISGYTALLKLMINTYSKKGWKFNNKDLAIRFFSGKEDPCAIKPELFGKSVHALKEVGYENVTANLYGGMRHEVLNERDKSRVYKDIYDFIIE